MVPKDKVKDIYAYGAYDPAAPAIDSAASPDSDDEDGSYPFFGSHSTMASDSDAKDLGDWNQARRSACVAAASHAPVHAAFPNRHSKHPQCAFPALELVTSFS